MRKSSRIALMALFTFLLVTAVAVGTYPAFAQNATPTPAAEEEGAAATPTPAVEEESTFVGRDAGIDAMMAGEAAAPEAFITMNLAAGFPLDPFLVSVNGGGAVDASTWGEGCVGFINDAPTVTIDWEGETEFVEVFFYSDSDPVLVIETPDGEYLCADDANDLLLDPVIELSEPAAGRYNVWVGSYAADQLIPGLLVVTTQPEINLGTFSVAGLIRRAAIPEDLIEHEEVAPGRLLRDGLTGELITEAEAEAVLAQEEIIDGERVELTVEGEAPAFELPVAVGICAGYIDEEPDVSFELEAEGNHLRIYFEGDADSTLVVQLPDGSILCNDDAVVGDNLNPLVDITDPPSGEYHVFVGRVQLDAPVSGELIVIESTDVDPADLDPVAPADE